MVQLLDYVSFLGITEIKNSRQIFTTDCPQLILQTILSIYKTCSGSKTLNYFSGSLDPSGTVELSLGLTFDGSIFQFYT